MKLIINTFISGLVAVAILITILSSLKSLIVEKYIFNDKAIEIVFVHQTTLFKNKVYQMYFESGRMYPIVLPSNHTQEELNNIKHNLIGTNLDYELKTVKIPFREEQRMISKVF